MYVSPNMTKLLFVRMHFIVTNVLSMLQEQHILLLLFLSLSMSLSSGLVDGNTDHHIQDTPLLLPETGDNIQVFLESILFYQTSLGVGLGDILFLKFLKSIGLINLILRKGPSLCFGQEASSLVQRWTFWKVLLWSSFSFQIGPLPAPVDQAWGRFIRKVTLLVTNRVKGNMNQTGGL